MIRSLRLSTLLSFAVLVACGTSAPPAENTDSTTDAGVVEEDDSCKPPDVPRACEYPNCGYGSNVNKKLKPFTLTNCDGSGDYEFVNKDFCESKLTVVSIAAGWCVPCQNESSMLAEQIVRKYKDRGVRVVQILVQNPDYTAPTIAFCKEWIKTYGIENTELIDPDGLVEPYFPSSSLPSTFIVDVSGTIRSREDGVSPNLESLRAELDKLLAE